MKTSLALAVIGQQLYTAWATAPAPSTCARASDATCKDVRSGPVPTSDHLLMQLRRSELNKVSQEPKPKKVEEPDDLDDPDVSIMKTATECCAACGDDQFCSPVSGNCYDWKRKNYYHTCAEAPKAESCCDNCGEGFCSPVSGNCYSEKRRHYYETCEADDKSPSVEPPEEPQEPSEPAQSGCCAKCMKGVAAFCSPRSMSCYQTQVKDYYESCPDGGDLEPAMQIATSSEGSVKFMSYNLYGWNAFNRNKWRSKVILDKIKTWAPAVLGAQEVETGGSSGYSTVRDAVVSGTGLAEGSGSQFFSDDRLEQLASIDYIPLVRGYWMSFAKYRQKDTGVEFLFFNSHWKHGYGMEQAQIVARKVAELREKHGALPTVLVGDTNQFCRAYERSGIKYLKGETGDSPITFVDTIEHDSGRSFSDRNNPDCRVDFILATKGEWTLVKSFIDRDGMGADGSASDHAPLMAELVPLSTGGSLMPIKA